MVVALHAACMGPMATCAHVTTCLLMHALVDAANCRQSELSNTRPPLQQLGHIYCSCHGGYAVQLWARCNSTGTDSSAAYMGPLVALTQARQVLDRPATTITRVLKGLGIRLHTEVSVARAARSAHAPVLLQRCLSLQSAHATTRAQQNQAHNAMVHHNHVPPAAMHMPGAARKPRTCHAVPGAILSTHIHAPSQHQHCHTHPQMICAPVQFGHALCSSPPTSPGYSSWWRLERCKRAQRARCCSPSLASSSWSRLCCPLAAGLSC